MSKPTIPRMCERCDRAFLATRYQVATGDGRFCSLSCARTKDPAERSKEQVRRFWRKVDRNGPVPPHMPHLGQCWQWTGFRLPDGYGRFRAALPGQSACMQAHRFSYILENGIFPNRLDVLHRCDNPSCVNPSHLTLGTDADNARDKAEKRRSLFGQRAPRAKLSDSKVAMMRKLHREGTPIAELARLYGVAYQTADAVTKRRSWRHVP